MVFWGLFLLFVLPAPLSGFDIPDPCSGGCVCLGNCGPHWVEGGSLDDLRWQNLQTSVRTPPQSKPPTISTWRKNLEGRLKLDRNNLKSNIENRRQQKSAIRYIDAKTRKLHDEYAELVEAEAAARIRLEAKQNKFSHEVKVILHAG